ncbi:MAG TPA: hypothetical protein VME45_14290 [Stellaceae bacterium]|nr:hypothetical protein [Stellaceae bacterium]
MTSWTIVRDTIGRHRRAWLTMTLGFTALYHAIMMVSASLSTGHWPNYIRFYNWPANVLRIIHATPSLTDMPSIINDEWLIETGAINYHYGHGIAEWSLAVIPSHVLVALLLSALVATSILLLKRSREFCPLAERGAGAAATGVGALFVGTANITMTWVACCATPSWVVGLSLLGIETSSAYALLPYGNALVAGGFAVLALTTWWLAWRCVPRPPREPSLLPKSLLPQDR